MSKEHIEPGSYIVTKGGRRGYVISRTRNVYLVRLPEGNSFVHENNLSLDQIIQGDNKGETERA